MDEQTPAPLSPKGCTSEIQDLTKLSPTSFASLLKHTSGPLEFGPLALGPCESGPLASGPYESSTF
jgi:hypothetical protein